MTDAEALLRRVLPGVADRQCVLAVLGQSIEIADRIGSSTWAVSVLLHGFRLNVGQVEVLVLDGEWLRVNLLSDVGSLPDAAPHILPARYRSIAVSHCAFWGPVAAYRDQQARLQDLHGKFIRQVAVTRTGSPRTTPFRRSHSDALAALARGAGVWLTAEDESLPNEPLIEGGRLTVQVNAYERSHEARRACIAHHGLTCSACGFSFGRFYGNAASGYVQVHHLRMLSSIGEHHEVDPVQDLRPVCANCHAVIHLRTPPYTIEEVRRMLKAPHPSAVRFGVLKDEIVLPLEGEAAWCDGVG